MANLDVKNVMSFRKVSKFAERSLGRDLVVVVGGVSLISFDGVGM